MEQQPLPEGPDIAIPTSFDSNKYSPKTKIGKPSIGTSGRVERVGLGGLTTITNYGNQSDVRPE